MPLPVPAVQTQRSWIQVPTFWLVCLTLALLSGQAFAPSGLVPPRLGLFAFLLPVPLFFRSRSRAWGLLAVMTLGFFSIGYVRHFRLLYPRFGPEHLRVIAADGAPVYVEGSLYREPERLGDLSTGAQAGRSRWYFKVERIWHPTGAEPAQGNVLITVRRERGDWRYGDRLRLWLVVRPPRNAGNPGEFDYEAFLSRREIYLTAFLAADDKVELLRRERHGPWVWVARARSHIRRLLERHLSPDEAALMKALVIGDRGGISREMREDFAVAGVAHLLAISGLHVGMLGLAVFVVARLLGSLSASLLLRVSLPKMAATASLLTVVLYAAVAGGMIPTVRAAIMTVVYVVAVLIDREDELLGSLCVAALIIALRWPGAAMDVSFQLSFLAVLAIIWGLSAVRGWWPERQRGAEALSSGRTRVRLRPVFLYLAVPVLASLGTGPVIAYHFGYFSLIGFVANPILVPAVGFGLVPLGFLVAFLSLIAQSLTAPFLALAGPLLSSVVWLVRFFAHLPMSSVSLPTPNVFEVGLIYLLIASLLFVARPKLGAFLLVVGVVGAMATGAYWWRERWSRATLRVTYLSVGHGDAAVIEFPGSEVLLIDAGGTASGEFDPGESIVTPFLRSRKIRRVDYVAVSHLRVDHYGGMQAVVNRFGPREFWSTAARGRSPRYLELEEAAARAGVRRRIVSGGDPCLAIDRAELCFLHPPKGDGGESSFVVRLVFGRAAFLFAGDVTRKEEKELLRSGAELRSAVIKVPRHGSSTSSSEEFVAAVRPRLAVVSAGHRNPFGLPREEVIARYGAAGAEILRTDRDGAVTIETDGESVNYRTYRTKKKGSVSF
jgi:competence protein ComEC